jgi:hypothetical protein
MLQIFTTCKRTTVFLVFFGCFGAASEEASQAQLLGLRVGPGGALLLAGKPIEAVGVNYYDCFLRALRDPANATYQTGFKDLKRFEIPFARFNAGGFWPEDWRRYQENSQSYFELFDGVVKAAEENGIGLIPSLFWNNCAVSDLVGEPRGALGNPNSKTNAFIQKYTLDVVKRYAASPAIWAWEFGNEYDLAVDLPNAESQRPPVLPKRGTPESRSAADDIGHDAILTAFTTFANAVRSVDRERPIFTGNSLPRPSSWHMWEEKSWVPDTRDQFAEQLVRFNPSPFNTISTHIYPLDHEKRFDQTKTSYDEIIGLAMDTAKSQNRALFVGEFGAPDDEPSGGREFARQELHEMLTALERNHVPLAAVWVYDFPTQESAHNITAFNQRSFALKFVRLANMRRMLYATGSYKADLSGGGFRGSLLDYVANANRSGNGFNPLQHDQFRGEGLFRDEMTGLYFEHIFNGTKKDHELAMFTPNKDRHYIKKLSDSSAIMVHPVESSSWTIASEMKYTLRDNGIDMEFKATPSVDRFPLGFCAFMWASYMNHTRERQIHFYGTNGTQEGWISFGEDAEKGFETGTVAHQNVPFLPYEVGAQTLNLIEDKNKRFIKPFYYGLVDGDGDFATHDDTMAYIMMFDQTEPIRFALWNFIRDFENNPNPHSPAWDWQFVIRDPKPGQTYGYRARMLYKRFQSNEDVAAEYDLWRASLPPR